MTKYLSNLYILTGEKQICYCEHSYLVTNQKNDGHGRDPFL